MIATDAVLTVVVLFMAGFAAAWLTAETQRARAVAENRRLRHVAEDARSEVVATKRAMTSTWTVLAGCVDRATASCPSCREAIQREFKERANQCAQEAAENAERPGINAPGGDA